MTALRLCLVSILVVLFCVGWAKQDPELKQCRHQCRHQEGFGAAERERCEYRCEEYVREKRSREREIGDDEGLEKGGEATQQSPYVFQDEHFESVVRTEQGRVHVLRKFTQRSKLLKRIENFRIGFLEANPRAFVAPVHLDADAIYFVAKGKPTVTLLREEKKETFNLEIGDILHIPAGTPVYTVNRDDREKLFIIKLISPVFLPGHFEPFYAAGGENPETFYTAFSWKILSAALKRDKEEIERLFRQQKRGSITSASREQVEELSRHGQEGGGGGGAVWPFRGETKGPFNLFRKTVQSNRYGKLFEAKPEDFKQLEPLDLIVSFANITRGAMFGPYYNSRATKISFVVDGEGFFEMACPHISSSEHSTGGGGRAFQRVSGQLRRGTVFVAPAGHPIAAVASPASNLQVVCFEVGGTGNLRFPLAGHGNVVSEMDNVAKELSFGVPVREVDRIFRSQKEEFFFPGPTQQEEHGYDRYAYI